MPDTSRPDESERRRLDLFQRTVRSLEESLAPYLRRGFFFVNIGANDGVAGDPIYPFVRPYGAHGLLVEPVPYVFEQLRRNYAGLPDMVFENLAVGPEATTRRFWYVDRGSGGLEYALNQIGSLDRQRLLDTIQNLRMVVDLYPATPPVPSEHADDVVPHEGTRIPDDLERFVREVEIECVPFNDLMARHGIEHIDFLNLDTEGFDHDICRSIDFDRYRPVVMCIETVEFPEGGVEELEERISPLGYRYLQDFGLHSRVYVRDAPG